MSYEIVLTVSMKYAVQKLKKQYRHITDDIEVAVNELQEQPRKGDVISGGYGIRKIRVANSDARRGKSGGYRMLYYLVDEPQQLLYLLLIYSKSDREDVQKKELIELLSAARLL